MFRQDGCKSGLVGMLSSVRWLHVCNKRASLLAKHRTLREGKGEVFVDVVLLLHRWRHELGLGEHPLSVWHKTKTTRR